ncbi:MAG: lipase family protein [Protaetiibacter sp.]
MTASRERAPRAWRALPGMLEAAAPWLRAVVGVALAVLGLLLVTRPLSALSVLAIYTGVSCILSGVLELLTAPAVSRRVGGGLWIAVGVAILVWFGGSIALLPTVLAVLLVAGGLVSLAGVFRGALAERVLAGVWALVQLVFGVLALVWPEVTVVVVAALFGVRTLLFGLALLGGTLLGSRRLRRLAARLDRRRMLLRWVAAVLLAALGAVAVWGTVSLRAGLPVLDAFYATPAQLPAGPGELLRAEPWPGEAPDGSSVTRILYTTTDAQGEPAVASGIVVVPDAGDGPFPVVAWNHGTTGIARNCAPSLMTDMFQIQGIPGIDQAIAAGWVVVATDYSGQGAEGDFPYLIGEGEGRSSLDAVRAAHRLDELSLSNETAIWGHSQGGHATLWTSAIAADYAPELDIVGTAAVSPAASPLGLAKQLESAGVSGIYAVLASWVLVPYAAEYPDVNIADYVAPAGRGLVREFAARCGQAGDILPSVLAALALDDDQPLYASNFTEGALGDRLAENETLGPFASPLFVAWGSDDEVISPELQHEYVAELCDAGLAFEYHEYPGFTHMSVLDDDSPLPDALVAWTAARFAGEPATVDSCGA